MKERESSFELLRLIAQYMIVAYHILLFWFVLDGPNPQPIFEALWIPLHIGVILYVLISGYFGIRFSIKGLMRILAQLLVYGLGLYLLNHFIYGDPIKIKQLFFVSNTPYWFIRTYLFLYLLAPMVNKTIANISLTTRIVMLVVLSWISCWTGLMGFDASMHEGYNVLHFVFLYLIGNTLYTYRDKFNSVPTYLVLSLYLIGAIGGVLTVNAMSNNSLLFNVLFQYNSLVLIFNAVLFFMLFMRMHFQSRSINYMASSCLAIYLLHGSDVLLRHGIKDGAFWIQESACLEWQIALLFVFALAIVFACIGIDKCLVPIWKLVNHCADKLSQTCLGKIVDEYNNC